jgi:sulfur-carrier protein adenylyltransferase/sulfurtransferase
MGETEPNDVKILFPDELKEFIEGNREGTYTLLDVRQPFEYEEAHLPGARLLPLPRLPDSLDELRRERITIVYCAMGGRSKMAAQFLSHQGFQNVYHLQGGIEAWEETTATGPSEFHLQFIRGDETAEEVVRLAYVMEEGLRRFHEIVQTRTDDAELSTLLGHLIKADESHKKALLNLLEDQSQRDELVRSLSDSSDSSLMEGGLDLADFLKKNERYLHTTSGYMELAMMIETQALDLYLRMADASSNSAAKEVLLRVGEEEKAHLALLGRYLDDSAR